jgi:hypothetical protein
MRNSALGLALEVGVWQRLLVGVGEMEIDSVGEGLRDRVGEGDCETVSVGVGVGSGERETLGGGMEASNSTEAESSHDCRGRADGRASGEGPPGRAEGRKWTVAAAPPAVPLGPAVAERAALAEARVAPNRAVVGAAAELKLAEAAGAAKLRR